MKIIVWLFSILPFISLGQVTIDFEDGTLTGWEQFPENRWGTDSLTPVSGNFSLYHSFDNHQSGEDRISIANGRIDPEMPVKWGFSIKHGYLPSSSNRWTIILMADRGASGFFQEGFSALTIGVNTGSTDDSLRIYRVSGNKSTAILTCNLNWEKDVGINTWFLSVGIKDGVLSVYGGESSTSCHLLGSTEYEISREVRYNYFGINFIYTSARDRLLWFDDLLIQADYIADTIPPALVYAKFLSRSTVELFFSEQIDPGLTKVENFLLEPGNKSPSSLSIIDNYVFLGFEEIFTRGDTYTIICRNIFDQEGNKVDNDSAKFLYYEAISYDILINEIMADPSPPVYLPEYEYLELYNRTQYPVPIENWSLEVGIKEYLLSGQIPPNGYLIITNDGAVELFNSYGNVAGLFTSVTALANSGNTIILKDRYGEIIDAVAYEESWYTDDFKRQGGWSLERIDPENVCAGMTNWSDAVSMTGGTPGSENSVRNVNRDFQPPFVKGVQIVSDREIRILFNESIAKDYFFEGNPFSIADGLNQVIRITPSLPFYNSCLIELMDPMYQGKVYGLLMREDFRDCAGNYGSHPWLVRFGMPVPPGFTDIIITEVLYSPYPGCPEFIEIYCNSDELLDLSGLILGINYGSGSETKREYVVNEQQLFFPGEYLALTTNPDKLENYYDILYPERLYLMKNMPSLRNEGGCIELTDRSFQLIDKYCYSKNDQFPLLNSDQGVSLERMNIDRNPGFLSHWHSASSVAGFGTPGYKNSQLLNPEVFPETISINPGTFTPDNDGYEDVAIISYHVHEEGYTGNIQIFNASGRQVKHIARNELLGITGSFVWDGRDESGQLSRTGIYLVYFDAFNLKGGRIRKKATVLLVRK